MLGIAITHLSRTRESERASKRESERDECASQLCRTLACVADGADSESEREKLFLYQGVRVRVEHSRSQGEVRDSLLRFREEPRTLVRVPCAPPATLKD